jgi:hypothetical protein
MLMLCPKNGKAVPAAAWNRMRKAIIDRMVVHGFGWVPSKRSTIPRSRSNHAL